MRPSTIRGTPYHHVDARAGQGTAPGTPKGMNGTSPEQYSSDHRGYQQDPRGGTPYKSQAGNPPGAMREVSHDEKGGVVISEAGQNHNDPHANGMTVLLDTHGAGEGFMPKEDGGVMDSPVPAHAARFEADFIPTEDAAHLGTGLEYLAAAKSNNDLRKLDGVMSRGTDSTSHPDEDEFELTRDDTLRSPEAGSMRDVQGHAERVIKE